MSIRALGCRLAVLEKRVDRLARKVSGGANDLNAWIDEVHGKFANDPAYRKAVRLGSAWRKSKVSGGISRSAN